ncbi:hypothetical protein IFM89_025597 [Coptis chinensis]|uniref:Uncharacterized protein n=1 Tax=Coptis chinensis TaxID=261450 RepID=A0A835IFJ5_9MAGN|nr:hypothetical protein IFM89_025597 [Coptis chinensis]
MWWVRPLIALALTCRMEVKMMENIWIDLPDDDSNNLVKNGDIESAEFYVHVKPALGGTFTAIVMLVFFPFNGPATIKCGMVNIPLSKVGQHVSVHPTGEKL